MPVVCGYFCITVAELSNCNSILPYLSTLPDLPYLSEKKFQLLFWTIHFHILMSPGKSVIHCVYVCVCVYPSACKSKICILTDFFSKIQILWRMFTWLPKMVWVWLLTNLPHGWGLHPSPWTTSFYSHLCLGGPPWIFTCLLSGLPGFLDIISMPAYYNTSPASLTVKSLLLLEVACSLLYSTAVGCCIFPCRAWVLSWCCAKASKPYDELLLSCLATVNVILRVSLKLAACGFTGCADQSPICTPRPLLLIVNLWSNGLPVATLTTHFLVFTFQEHAHYYDPLSGPRGSSFQGRRCFFLKTADMLSLCSLPFLLQNIPYLSV